MEIKEEWLIIKGLGMLAVFTTSIVLQSFAAFGLSQDSCMYFLCKFLQITTIYKTKKCHN